MNKKALFPLIGLFLLVTGIVLPGSAHAQISEGGTPASFKYQNTLKSDLPTVQIPINFSVEDMKTVDRWQVSQGAPLKVSQLIPTDLSIDNAGNWTTLPGGEKIWVESTSKCNYSHKNEIHPKIVIIKRKINKDLRTLK